MNRTGAMLRGLSAGPEQDVGIGWYLGLVALALLAYLFGLDGRYIPKNGDENVYLHILRLTADSGHLLPLQSDLDGMRNTKPPMLFWQGIASTGWGADWSLTALRWPGVVWTFGVAAMVFGLGWRLSGSAQRGLVGMLAFLGCFSIFRYGRPYLTNAPEWFWLFLPFFVLAWRGAPAFESRLLAPVGFALAIGIGLLYKSFALLFPVGIGLAWWYLHLRSYKLGDFVVRDLGKLLLVAVLSLAVFGLWFALDPDPRAIWQEFVVGENAEKFDAEGGYLRTLLWGGSSLWSLAANYPLNAGLLAFPFAAVFVVALRRRRETSLVEQLLWIWVLVLFVVFALPSQRSGRYLLPAMPALAALLALHWERVSRWVFMLTLVAAALVAGLIGWLSWKLDASTGAPPLYGAAHWTVLGVTAAVVLTGLFVPRLTRWSSLAATFLVLLCFSATVHPLDGPVGRYGDDARRAVAGRDVHVPCNFRAMYEGHRFLLPGANVLGYDDSGAPDAAALAQRFPLFAVRVPLGASACGDDCRVIGERLEIRGRHSRAQIDEMLAGKIFENLFVREVLVESRVVPAPAAPSPGTTSECR